MKTRIRKDVKTWHYVAIFASAIVLLGIGFWWPQGMSELCLLWIVSAIAVCSDYYIVDKTYLKRFFQKVDIRQVHDIVQQSDGIDLLFRNVKNGQEKVLHLRPRDKEELIAKLLEINPNIKIK